MTPSPQNPQRGPASVAPLVTGTAYCVLSALSYTGANICMRRLVDLGAHPMWVVFNKESVAALVGGLWVLWRVWHGLPALPPSRSLLAILIAVGLIVQVIANPTFQWSLGVVGLAVAIPTLFGVMLAAGAILGFVVLNERVSWRSSIALTVLVTSLVLLGLAVRHAGQPVVPTSLTEDGLLLVALGVGGASLAGVVYAVLATAIRHTVSQATPQCAVIFITTFMAVPTLGPLCLGRLGLDHLLTTPPQHSAWMLGAGLLNLLGFIALIQGLALTTVVHASMLNASQVAMASLAGILLFREPMTGWLVVGVLMTILGIVLIDRPQEPDNSAPETPPPPIEVLRGMP